jgi:hypothetical protein
MMTTLIVLATLIAAPLLFGVLLAVGLASFMALYFGSEWMRELRFAQATAPGSAASAGPTKDQRRDFAMTYVRESSRFGFCYALGELIGETASRYIYRTRAGVAFVSKNAPLIHIAPCAGCADYDEKAA